MEDSCLAAFSILHPLSLKMQFLDIRSVNLRCGLEILLRRG